jgi:hypothetical protein
MAWSLRAFSVISALVCVDPFVGATCVIRYSDLLTASHIGYSRNARVARALSLPSVVRASVFKLRRW